jgi:cation:H+ antiporter
LLFLYARAGKRAARFHLDYGEVRTDLTCFLIGYGVAVGCVFVPSRTIHAIAAVGLIGLYLYYMKMKLSATDENEGEGGGGLEPLLFAKQALTPSYGMIGLQGFVGLAGLIMGAHLFVTTAETVAGAFSLSPLILALLIAPLATELPEMSNSFLWLYRKKDRLAVGNVTGAMVFQGTFPVSVGLLGTEWALAPSAVATMLLAVAAAGFCLLQIVLVGHWRPRLLCAGVLLYIGYTAYLYGF